MAKLREVKKEAVGAGHKFNPIPSLQPRAKFDFVNGKNSHAPKNLVADYADADDQRNSSTGRPVANSDKRSSSWEKVVVLEVRMARLALVVNSVHF